MVQGWYPLGGRRHTGELLGDSLISEIAGAHGVSSAQVILRWNLQKGVAVIPGSSNPDQIRENMELYHFSLTEDEMVRIGVLDRAKNMIGIRRNDSEKNICFMFIFAACGRYAQRLWDFSLRQLSCCRIR